MPSNQAAYLTGKGERPLVIREAPYLSPGAYSITIKNKAFAVNPVDSGVQDLGLFVTKWPHILGCDVAGVVVEVGKNVTHVKPGDRVLGMSSKTADASENALDMAAGTGTGGFQLFSVVDAKYAAKLPANVSFEEGSVLPLATLTSVSSLFLPKFLGLEFPTSEAKDRGEYILVWGGASSVGSCGIQFAVNSGYRVITTCSSTNVAYCEGLGAEKAFDYKADAAVDNIVEYAKGKNVVGIFDAISYGGSVEKCVEVAQKIDGTKEVVTVRPGTETGHPDEITVRPNMANLASVDAMKIFADFLPKALESGKFKAKPDPLIVGKGLESAQEALDAMRAGVSARKVVVSL